MGSMNATVAPAGRKSEKIVTVSMITEINTRSFVPTKERILFPMTWATPVSKSALPKIIMPAAKKTVSFPKPEKAVEKGIIPVIANTRQPPMEVTVRGMTSVEYNISIQLIMMSATVLDSKTHLFLLMYAYTNDYQQL